jgi:spore germination cell wall hydrolase CwlJ-like protein
MRNQFDQSDLTDANFFWGGFACIMIVSVALIGSYIFDLPGGTKVDKEPGEGLHMSDYGSDGCIDIWCPEVSENPSAQEASLSPLSQPLESEVTKYNERELECLALNSYFESRNQSVAGQIAVAQVVLNRVESPRFPNTICDVIQQGPTYKNWKGNELPVRNKCHFSWWCDGLSDIPKDEETYRGILSLVTTIVEDKPLDITSGSLYYHADYSSPWWINSFTQTMVIDDHVFYTEKDD